MAGFSADELLRRWATERPTDVAFADENIQVTFADIDIDARKVATVLAQKGISRGDIVVIALPPYLAWTFSFALQLVGSTILPKSIETSFPSEIHVDWFIGLAPDPLAENNQMIVVDNPFLDLVRASLPIERAPGYGDGDIPVFLFSTSGTTGTKKYVAFNPIFLEEAVAQRWPVDWYGADALISLPPFGGMGSTILALKRFTQGKLFANPGQVSGSIIETISKNGVHTMFGSPAQIAALLDLFERENLEVPDLQVIILGGSISSETLINRIRGKFNCTLLDAYGSTEGGAIAMSNLTESTPVGMTVDATVDLQIVDDAHQQLPKGSVGRVRYKRSGMAHSYFRNEIATQEFFSEGYFYPGDLAYLSTSGELVLVGRDSEILNLGGLKISPTVLDELGHKQPGVKDCAAFSLPGKSGIDELAMAVVSKEGFDEQEFRKALAEETRWPLAHLFVVESLPYNPNGKVMRGDLTNLFSENSSTK